MMRSDVVPAVVTTFFAFEVSEVAIGRLAILVFLDQQAGADFEDIGGERDLLSAFGVVGGGTALDVHGAVLHQRDTGLGSDQVVLGLQLGLVQVFFRASTIAS